MAANSVKILVPNKFKVLYDSSYRYYVFKGGRGSSKSHSVARYLITLALTKKTKILCLREFQNSINESVYSLLKNTIIEYGLDCYFRILNTSIECVNGSEFIFKGLALNIASVKSMEGVDVVWVEEADKVSQNSWDILIPTIRKSGSKFYVNYNPVHEDDPVHDMFVTRGVPDAVVTDVNWQDNPWFPEVLRKEMLHMKATNYDMYMHVWEGQLRTISDAQVFKGKFVVEEFESDDIDSFLHGLDFGFSSDPTAIIRSFIRGQDLYIDREEGGHHIDINHYHKLLDSIFDSTGSKLWTVYADCSRPESISYLRNQCYNVEPAKKWPNSVEDGVEYLKSYGKIIIHPRCTRTIEEFRRYSYKVDKYTDKILPIIKDDYNHFLDALRYSHNDLILQKRSIFDHIL